MTDLLETVLRIEAPPGWHRVPGTDVDAWADALVGPAGPDAVAALVAVAAAANAEPPRVPFVFTGDGPVAQAWAFLRLLPRTEPDAGAAAAAAAAILEGPSRGEVRVWHREVSPITVGGAPGVRLADLLTLPGAPDERQVQRRVIVTWFPPEQVCLHLTLSTPSSTLGDIAGEALAFAEGVRLGEAAA